MSDDNYIAKHSQDLLSAIVIAHGIKCGGLIENMPTFVRLMEDVTRDYQHPMLSLAWRFAPIVSTLLEAMEKVYHPAARSRRSPCNEGVFLSPQSNQPSEQSRQFDAAISARLESLLSNRLKYQTQPRPADALHPASCPLCFQSIPPMT